MGRWGERRYRQGGSCRRGWIVRRVPAPRFRGGRLFRGDDGWGGLGAGVIYRLAEKDRALIAAAISSARV